VRDAAAFLLPFGQFLVWSQMAVSSKLSLHKTFV